MLTFFYMIIRSRLGQITIAIAVGIIAYNLWVHFLHKEWTAAEQGKAAVQVQEKTKEVQDDIKKRENQVDEMAPGDLLDYWHGNDDGMRKNDDYESGAAASS